MIAALSILIAGVWHAVGLRKLRKLRRAPNCNWQCYLDRYPDLQQHFGKNNVEAAKAHWHQYGKQEGRSCTCELFLDNGVVKLGVDIGRGGAISHFGPSGSGLNLVNTFDLGRFIQLSYYSGPSFYNPGGRCNKLFRGQAWGWNPIGAGDIKHNAGAINTLSFHGAVGHIVTTPLQWACDNVPCECEFEQQIELGGPGNTGVKVVATLHNHRSDKSKYPAKDQELPAVYSNGPYYRIITTQRGKIKELQSGWNNSAAFPWLPGAFTADEHWAALVDKNGWGMGVVQFDTTQFIGGFAGKKGSGGTHNTPTGYIAPVKKVALPAKTTYKYTFHLVLGDIHTIRGYARKLRAS